LGGRNWCGLSWKRGLCWWRGWQRQRLGGLFRQGTRVLGQGWRGGHIGLAHIFEGGVPFLHRKISLLEEFRNVDHVMQVGRLGVQTGSQSQFHKIVLQKTCKSTSRIKCQVTHQVTVHLLDPIHHSIGHGCVSGLLQEILLRGSKFTDAILRSRH